MTTESSENGYLTDDSLDFVIRCKLADHDDLSDDLCQTSKRIERLRVEILDRLGVEE